MLLMLKAHNHKTVFKVSDIYLKVDFKITFTCLPRLLQFFTPLGDRFFICWITLHQLKIFRLVIGNMKMVMVKYTIVTYCTFPMLGNICKWPFCDQQSDTVMLNTTLYLHKKRTWPSTLIKIFQWYKSVFLKDKQFGYEPFFFFEQILVFQIGG